MIPRMPLEQTVRALQVVETTGPSGVAVRELPKPRSDGKILINVKAAGISFPDLLLSRGEYQIKPDPPFTLGVEAAGVVADAPDNSGFAPGDRVAAFHFGACVEQIAAEPMAVFKIADKLSFEQAAGLVMNYQTVHFALSRRGRIQSGDTVLIQGAAGGIGTAGIQVAKGLGGRVIAVVSTDEKAQVAKTAGADEVVLLDGWRNRVKELTEGRGVDLVLDPVGGDRFIDNIRVLAPEGRVLVVGFADGEIPSVPVNRLLLKNVDLVGVAWGAFMAAEPQLLGEIGRSLDQMVERGVVNPLVGQTFALDDGARALEAIDERRATGKVVVTL